MVYEQGIHEELLAKGGYYEQIIRPQLLKEELDNHNIEEENIRKLTTVKRVNTDEEVHFERRDKELSKSTDDVTLKCCNIIKMLWNYKCLFISSLLATIIHGSFPSIKGLITGYGTNALDSMYQTVRYDDGLKYSIIYLIIGCLNATSFFSYSYSSFSLGIQLSKLYRNYLLKKYLSFHIAFFDIERNSPGSLVTKMSIDTIQLQYSLRLIVGHIIAGLTCAIVSLIFGACYEYRIALATFVFLPFLIVLTLIRRCAVQVDSPKSLKAGTDGGRILSECVTGSKTVFSNNFTKEALRLYLEAIDYITQSQVRDNIINAVCFSLTIFCNYMINVVIFALSKKYILDESLTSEDMVIIQIIMGDGFAAVCGFMSVVWRIRKAIASLRSIYSVLDTDTLISPFLKDNIGKVSANNIMGKIEFKNVYFAYPFQPEHVILKNVSFTILPGQKVALVGNSGCGKSSIILLINRFYDVEDGKGEILIDDINIKDYNLYELKKKIGFVQQEPSAFNRSAIENIRYGNLEATDDECYKAAKEVNALSVLKNEKEEKLPAGEKQKLAIARIFLKNPPILLLDEPTSALDKESEMEIEKSLEILSENKTTVTIAHRLNTIEKCDKIIVFDNGRIKEQGTHDELMKLHKRYYTLHKFSNLG